MQYKYLDEGVERLVDRYIGEIIDRSTPTQPLWNIESIKQGKKPAWNYIDGCMISGLLSLYEQTKEQKLLDFAHSFIDYYVLEDGSIVGYNPEEFNIDNISEGRVLFDLYRIFKKEKFRKAIDTIYSQILRHPRTKDGNFWHKKIYPHQVWLDGLYMAQVFYMRYETEFNNNKNYGDILNQYKNVRKFMFNEEKKLYHHGFDSEKQIFWADKTTGLSKSFWLRAMCWYIISIIDVLEHIDKRENEMYIYLEALYREAIEGILQYIDLDTRMMHQVVDCVGKAGNYAETSGSAMLCYAILKGVRLNVVTSGYVHTARAIFNGICDKYLYEKDGKMHLGGICLVSGLGPENNLRRDGSYEYYISEPVVEDDAKGLGPFLMAYTEMKKIK